jgi:hypothetical protein
MLLTVRVPEWEFEEDGRILSVGDEERFWLAFQEVERWAPPAEQVNVILGVALPLPTWPGAEFGRYPVQINVDGGALYWDAPGPVAGLVEVAGAVSTNNVDVPDDFPETTGVLRRVRMEWQDFVMSPSGWRSKGEGTRYEEVATTYSPASEPRTFEPEVEEELIRQARQAHDRAVAAGRVDPGESFEVGLFVSHAAREVPPGTTATRWTGVLIDLETSDATKG